MEIERKISQTPQMPASDESTFSTSKSFGSNDAQVEQHFEPEAPPSDWADALYAEVQAKPEVDASVFHGELQPHEWSMLVEKLHVRGLEKQLAQQSELIAFNDRFIELRCENRMLATSPIAVSSLEKRLNGFFKDKTRSLKVQLGSVQATPAREKAQVRAQELEGAQKLVSEHPTIQALVQEFDGMIVPSSVQAI